MERKKNQDDESWKTRKERCSKLDVKIKQKILDLMWKGKTIGEVMKKLNLDLHLVSEVVLENISTYNYLNKDAKC